MFAAELSGLPEYLFHHGVVFPVPVDGGHPHQDGNVLVQGIVVQLQRSLDGSVISLKTGVLDAFGMPSQALDVLSRQKVQPAVGFLGARRREDGGV